MNFFFPLKVFVELGDKRLQRPFRIRLGPILGQRKQFPSHSNSQPPSFQLYRHDSINLLIYHRMSELSEIDEAIRYAKTMKRAHVCRYECYLPFLFMDFKRARISEVDGKKCTHKKKRLSQWYMEMILCSVIFFHFYVCNRQNERL